MSSCPIISEVPVSNEQNNALLDFHDALTCLADALAALKSNGISGAGALHFAAEEWNELLAGFQSLSIVPTA